MKHGINPAGLKDDAGKPDYSLLPWSAIEQVARVQMHGAKKYERDNWKHLITEQERVSAAMMRHLAAWFDGEKTDPETGLPHLAHAVCNGLFLLWFELKGAE